MEIVAQLNAPYTEQERIEFVVEYNHKQGFLINEKEDYIQALQKTESEKIDEEKERIAHLHLTKREVFLGLYKAVQIEPEQIRSRITNTEAKIEFDYATDYYRGNPLIDEIGKLIGFTPYQLDKFFETNDYHYLIG